MSQPTSNAVSSTTYKRRIQFELSQWDKYNPLGRATYGTLAFALVLFPVTLPALLVLSVPLYFGLKRQRLWPLALLGFLGLAALWLMCVIGVLNFD